MPFTVEEFCAVFARQNEAIFPLQILAYVAAAAVLVALSRPSRASDSVIFAVLAGMWLVNGVVYHIVHFAPINPAARLFGALFLVEASLLAAAPLLARRRIVFAPTSGVATTLGLVLIAFALVLYPALGLLAGHRYPAMPMFGVAPCPSTIFTIGVLVLGNPRVTRWLLVVPVLWAFVGGSAAVVLDVPQDSALFLAAMIAIVLAFRRPAVA